MGKSEEIKKTDGRKYNKRLKPKPISTKDKIVPARTTKTKKDRISSYAVSAMKAEFGSEREFFMHLAQQSKQNFNALKLFLEYAYGKPSDSIDKDNTRKSKTAPVINFQFNGDIKQQQDIIDITPDDDE